MTEKEGVVTERTRKKERLANLGEKLSTGKELPRIGKKSRWRFKLFKTQFTTGEVDTRVDWKVRELTIGGSAVENLYRVTSVKC